MMLRVVLLFRGVVKQTANCCITSLGLERKAEHIKSNSNCLGPDARRAMGTLYIHGDCPIIQPSTTENALPLAHRGAIRHAAATPRGRLALLSKLDDRSLQSPSTVRRSAVAFRSGTFIAAPLFTPLPMLPPPSSASSRFCHPLLSAISRRWSHLSLFCTFAVGT